MQFISKEIASHRPVNREKSKLHELTKYSTNVPMTITRTKPKSKKEIEKNEDRINMLSIDPIIINCIDDCNIITINESVKNYLSMVSKQKLRVKKSIDAMNVILKSSKAIEDVAKAELKIRRLADKLQKLNKIRVSDYESKTSPLIEKYSKLKACKSVIFGREAEVDIEKEIYKTEIVNEFLEIAGSFYPIVKKNDRYENGLCGICSGTMVEDESSYYCSECFLIQRRMEIPPEVTDVEDTYTVKSYYERGGNFQNIVKKFQGTFHVKIPEQVIDSLKEEINSYKGITIDNISKRDLFVIMKQLSLTEYYDHINTIYYMLTGIPPPDLSEYENNLYLRGCYLDEIYDEIKAPGRTKFLHGLSLLWIFLKNEGYEPDMNDFCTMKGRDVEVNTILTLKKGFEILSKTHPEMSWKIYELP